MLKVFYLARLSLTWIYGWRKQAFLGVFVCFFLCVSVLISVLGRLLEFWDI